MIIREPERITHTDIGIIVPDAHQTRDVLSEVVAVGGPIPLNGCMIEPEVEPGDLVFIAKFSGDLLTVDGEKRILCRWTDIRAIVPKSDQKPSIVLG